MSRTTNKHVALVTKLASAHVELDRLRDENADLRNRMRRAARLLRQMPELDDEEYLPVQALAVLDMRKSQRKKT